MSVVTYTRQVVPTLAYIRLTCPVLADFERPASQEEDNTEQPSTSGSPRPSVYDLIWHATDSSVKPIVANRRIERLPEPKWDARALPFKALVSHTSCFFLFHHDTLNQQGPARSPEASRYHYFTRLQTTANAAHHICKVCHADQKTFTSVLTVCF